MDLWNLFDGYTGDVTAPIVLDKVKTTDVPLWLSGGLTFTCDEHGRDPAERLLGRVPDRHRRRRGQHQRPGSGRRIGTFHHGLTLVNRAVGTIHSPPLHASSNEGTS